MEQNQFIALLSTLIDTDESLNLKLQDKLLINFVPFGVGILYVWPGMTTGSDGTKKVARTNAPIAKSRQNEGELCLELRLFGQ